MEKAIIWDLLKTLGGNSRTLMKDFLFFDTAIPALRYAQENGFLNLVVTNQSHIAHGRMTMEEYEAGINRIKQELKRNQVSIQKFYVCPHKRADHCQCKKPNAALVFQAEKEFNLNLKKCYVVGDTWENDIRMAHNCGSKSVWIRRGDKRKVLSLQKEVWKTYTSTLIASNPLDAIRKIVAQKE